MQYSNMETWFIYTMLSLCVSIILKGIHNLLYPGSPLPPGPPRLPIIGNITLLKQYANDPKTILKNLHARYGPIFTLKIGSRMDIFIADRFLAHHAFIQNGSIFADRPKVTAPTQKIMSSNQHDILFSFYGPRWRLLRRNLSSKILHPLMVKSYAHVRKLVLDMLFDRLKSELGASDNTITITNHFQHAIFTLLALMCFGDKLEEKQIREIQDSQRAMVVRFTRYNILSFCPPITRILFQNRWKEFLQLWRDQQAVLIPLIDARKKAKEERRSNAKEEDEFVVSYVDTLLDLQLPEGDKGSKLDYGNICTLCTEFLTAGSDTTATALDWIMANLVKYPDIQERVVEEIRGIMAGREDKLVKDQDLEKLPYLKAVVLEGLRRHPPVHFLAHHRVTKDVVLNGYLVPTSASVNVFVAEIGRDPTAWDDPMAFKPGRFMDNSDQNGGTTFDIMGSKEIKMMPFGIGRRMCPGYSVAIHHLEYFVANLVWNFEWKAASGDDVDMSEKLQFTVVMKNPLKVHILPRQ